MLLMQNNAGDTGTVPIITYSHATSHGSLCRRNRGRTQANNACACYKLTGWCTAALDGGVLEEAWYQGRKETNNACACCDRKAVVVQGLAETLLTLDVPGRICKPSKQCMCML